MAAQQLDAHKIERRMELLTESLESLRRVGCQSSLFCLGPKAPPRAGKTCYRCQTLHRGALMGMIKL